MNGFPAVADPVNESAHDVGPKGWPTRTVAGKYASNGWPDPMHATPAVKLLREAVFYIDAANSQAGERWAINQGSGGAALNARYGSLVSANSNDPLLLTKRNDEPNYVYLPGVASNSLSVPDAAGFTPTTALSLRAALTLPVWSPPPTCAVMGQYNSPNFSWLLQLRSSGLLRFTTSTDGTNVVNMDSTATISAGAGTPLAVRVDWTASPAEVKFYTKPTSPMTASADCLSDSGWTQLGATVTASVPSTALFNAAVPVYIGSLQTGSSPVTGLLHAATVGVDGANVLTLNCATDVTSSAATSFTATSGQTVTVNRSTSGRKTVLVTRPCWLFGTDDYLEVPNHPLLDMANNQSFTALAVVRQWATPVSTGRYMAKGLSSGNSWNVMSNSTTLRVRGFCRSTADFNVDGAATFTAGSLQAATMVVDRKTNTVTVTQNTTPGTAVAISSLSSMSNISPLRVGSHGGGASFQDFELVAAAVFRRALSTTEIATINSYFGTA